MSLQVCHCGWSKVTTYQGLRIHQGKMGCTPRGVRVAESEQQYMWGNVGLPDKQQDLWVDVYTSIKTDTTDCYSGTSLQVCHCGWTKMTTYQGLRIHQGKMGCTPKGVRIPEKEQYDWKNRWEEVDQRKHQPAKKVIIKKEKVPVPPRINAPAVRPKEKNNQVTIKEEPYTPFAIPQRSFQTATNSKSGRELHDFSSGVQVNRSIREHPAIYPVPAARPKEKNKNDQTLSQNVPVPPRINVRAKSAAPTAPIKEEYEATAIPHRSSPRATNPTANHQLHEISTSVQANGSIRKLPTALYPVPAVRPKEKNNQATIKEEPYTPFAIPQRSFQTATNSKSGRELHDFSSGVQVNRSVRESPTAPSLPTVVRPKKKERKDQTSSQAGQERLISELELKIQMKEEKMQKKAADRACESVPHSTSNTSQTNSAAVDVTAKEDPKSLCETAQVSDFSSVMKVKQLARMFSAATQQTAVQRPKEKHQEEPKVPQVKPLAQRFLAATAQETAVQPKEQDREDQKLVPDSTSAKTKLNPAAAEATRKEDSKSQCETAQLSDFSTRLKVKQMAWMFSDTTYKTAVRPKEKHNEERKLAQAKQERSKSELEQIIQMREEKMSDIRAAERACESVADSTSTTTQTNSSAAVAITKEDPKSLCETGQDSDFSAGMTVKQLALMFSATTQQTAVQRPKQKHQEEPKLPQVKPLAQKLLAATAQETAVQPKEQDRVHQKLVPDSTSAKTKLNSAAAEATRKEDSKSLSETAPDFSTGLKVKQLAWMFSATNQETAVQLKEKHQEERKPAQVRQDRIPADIKHKVEMRERNVAEGRSSVKACKHSQGSLDRGLVESDGELSEVMEDAQQKSLPFSTSALRNTKSTMEQIHQKLEKSSSIEHEWITKFAVDVKLDAATAHRCLVDADGKKVRAEPDNQKAADAPEKFDLFGSILGLNRLTTGKSYWEVEVSNKTGWDLGVARGDTDRKGKLLLNPDDGYWAIVHFENKEYAALTAPPVHLSLKEKLQKVGVFVDYEEGLVSFYNVTGKSHIYSFTQCLFTGEICPYFSLHLDKSADPLIISTVKHQ